MTSALLSRFNISQHLYQHESVQQADSLTPMIILLTGANMADCLHAHNPLGTEPPEPHTGQHMNLEPRMPS